MTFLVKISQYSVVTVETVLVFGSEGHRGHEVMAQSVITIFRRNRSNCLRLAVGGFQSFLTLFEVYSELTGNIFLVILHM